MGTDIVFKRRGSRTFLFHVAHLARNRIGIPARDSFWKFVKVVGRTSLFTPGSGA